ncbi:MAG: hypothetical protein KDD70_02600 [Bdellovibrionales bacterium]|nr:hypothetical protein [Bdellovibrionales bacterium]
MKRAASDYPWLTDSAPLNPDTAVDVSSYYSIGAALVIEIRNFAEKLGSLGVSSSIEGLSNAGAFIQRTEERLRPVKGEGTKAWMEHCWAHYTGN